MRTSNELKNLAIAFVKAQTQMGSAHKGAVNPYYESRYADLQSVLEVIKPALAANGLAFLQFPISADGVAGVTTRLLHESGEWIEDDFLLPISQKNPQAVGSCVSYARRYSMQSICGIAAEDDDGNAASNVYKRISDSDMSKITHLIEQTNTDVKKFCLAFGISTVNDLPASQSKKAISMLEKKK